MFSYSEQFDKVKLSRLYIEFDEIEQLAAEVDEVEQKALEKAFYNIHKFHLS
ncbi:bifunctional histidinal dehydrogenase/ histidinol dehydrogenase [compost metagenome]